MTSLNFGSLNINGCRSAEKRTALFDLIVLKKANIVFLQETHTDGNNQAQWMSEWRGQSFFSHGSNVSAGVAFLISGDLQIQDHKVTEIIPGRMQMLEFKLFELFFSLINVYAPNVGIERVNFFKKLKSVISEISNNRIIFLAGDFNCTLDYTMDRNHIEPHLNSAETLKTVIQFHNLVDVWREAFPSDKQYTWLKINDNTVSGARLDRIYVQKGNRGRFFNSFISPIALSDHHYIAVTMSVTQTMSYRNYWRFNNRLLQDKSFTEFFSQFWREWRERKLQYKTLSQWWDIGKVQIQIFCQQYTKNRIIEMREKVKFLEQQILKLSSSIGVGEDTETAKMLENYNLLLKNLYEERSHNTSVRGKFLQFNSMDSSTNFFFSLEKKIKEKKNINYLKMSNGKGITEKKEIISQVLQFYEDLYSAQPCNVGAVEQLLDGLPQLGRKDKAKLERSLSLQELSKAVQQQSTGKTPGLDGLTPEFFKFFWSIIGQDLHAVFLESFESKILPLSCRRAVVTLLPKKGDLGLLKNWRPVSLLGTDYKILSKALTNRLKKFLASIIHGDQSYCIPKRSIFDNLFLVRDMLYLTEVSKSNLGLVCLDQEKAFDKVDHKYLFKTLESFGFGNQFTSWIKLLYKDVYSMLKVNGTLTRPFSVQRGVRQGCSLSGLLYTISIEPLLRMLREKLQGVNFSPFHLSHVPTVKLTAYADDITVIIRSQDDVEHLFSCLNIFQKASSARVNWEKTDTLLLGHWSDQSPPQLPHQCPWNKEGVKILGLFFGTEQYMKKNWEGLIEKVTGKLQRWKWIQARLSYRGRVLVVNNLAASMLWHRLTVLDPPKDLLLKLQKVFVDFFWGGHYWLPPGVLCLPVSEGGQGLIHLTSKVKAMRLQTAQKLLYSSDSAPWISFGLAILQTKNKMGFDKQLFLISENNVKDESIIKFYQSVFEAWRYLKLERREHFGFEEPLFFNPWLCQKDILSDTDISNCVSAGVTKVGDLLDLSKREWLSVQVFTKKIGSRSERIVGNILKRLKTSFPKPLQEFTTNFMSDNFIKVPFPELYVTPKIDQHRNDNGDDANMLLSFKGLQSLPFSMASKQNLYNICVKSFFVGQLGERRDTKWRTYFSLLESKSPSWRSLYKNPLPKRSGDLQWRILHCSLATKVFLFKCKFSDSSLCIVCQKPETVFHIFCECCKLFSLFNILDGIFNRLGLNFSKIMFIYGYEYSRNKKEVCTFLNFLLGQAKLAIWKAYKIGMEGQEVSMVKLFKALVESRICLEYEYYRANSDELIFRSKWCLNKGLVFVEDENLIFNWE